MAKKYGLMVTDLKVVQNSQQNTWLRHATCAASVWCAGAGSRGAGLPVASACVGCSRDCCCADLAAHVPRSTHCCLTNA